MFLKKKTVTYMENYWESIDRLRQAAAQADAVVIGAGSGLSSAAGLTYEGKRFTENFADFIARYHYEDMYSATFYPYDSLEEYWAYMSRHIYHNRYVRQVGEAYQDLLRLVWNRDYFVITTNVDHCFQATGFDKKRLFYTQGDYGLWQCEKACYKETYSNEDAVMRMVKEQRDMKIPSELIPYCPRCGSPMSMNLRCDDTFVEDEGWHEAAHRYMNFLGTRGSRHVLFLELGVGGNTPGIIKYPFWQMAAANPKAVYACVNSGEGACPGEIQERSICIDGDIAAVLAEL